MPSKIKPGSCVQLMTFSPTMTVERVGETMVDCVWFNHNDQTGEWVFQRASFVIDALMLIETA